MLGKLIILLFGEIVVGEINIGEWGSCDWGSWVREVGSWGSWVGEVVIGEVGLGSNLTPFFFPLVRKTCEIILYFVILKTFPTT